MVLPVVAVVPDLHFHNQLWVSDVEGMGRGGKGILWADILAAAMLRVPGLRVSEQALPSCAVEDVEDA
jgi:hypothetical protein